MTMVIAKPKLILYESQSIITTCRLHRSRNNERISQGKYKEYKGVIELKSGAILANTMSPPERKILVIETGSEITDIMITCI